MIHNTQRGYRFVNGQRYYFKSKWEHRMALYLEHLRLEGSIHKWLYEPKGFIFAKIQSGTRKYVPDFQVFVEDGHYWIEVKGYMDAKSKTKLKRFAKYFPEEKLVLVDKDRMDFLNKKYGYLDGWE